jgi:hypothetical protein
VKTTAADAIQPIRNAAAFALGLAVPRTAMNTTRVAGDRLALTPSMTTERISPIAIFHRTERPNGGDPLLGNASAGCGLTGTR